MLEQMEEDHPTTTWEALQDGNVFYRRQQLYSIPGKLPQLGDFLIAGCRYGGPIGASLTCVKGFFIYNQALAAALMRDTTKIVALSGTNTAFAKSQIQIYSSAGEGLVLFSVVISQHTQIFLD